MEAKAHSNMILMSKAATSSRMGKNAYLKPYLEEGARGAMSVPLYARVAGRKEYILGPCVESNQFVELRLPAEKW